MLTPVTEKHNWYVLSMLFAKVARWRYNIENVCTEGKP